MQYLKHVPRVKEIKNKSWSIECFHQSCRNSVGIKHEVIGAAVKNLFCILNNEIKKSQNRINMIRAVFGLKNMKAVKIN